MPRRRQFALFPVTQFPAKQPTHAEILELIEAKLHGLKYRQAARQAKRERKNKSRAKGAAR